MVDPHEHLIADDRASLWIEKKLAERLGTSMTSVSTNTFFKKRFHAKRQSTKVLSRMHREDAESISGDQQEDDQADVGR